MEVHGEGNVPVSISGLMRWVYGRVLGEVGRSFVVIPDLRWEMAQRLDFGMIFGVGIRPSGSLSSFIWYCFSIIFCCGSCEILWRCYSVECELC